MHQICKKFAKIMFLKNFKKTFFDLFTTSPKNCLATKFHNLVIYSGGNSSVYAF